MMVPAPDGTTLRFAAPWVLAGGIPLVVLLAWRLWRRRPGHFLWSDLRLLRGVPRSARERLHGLLPALRGAALLLLLLALARPQLENRLSEVVSQGIDIVVALDQSGSMAAVDLGRRDSGEFDPVSRLDVARRLASDFIRGRRADRIGLVVFAGQALTRCPLTLDYDLLLQILEGVEITRRHDGTAIGMGLATAVNRLRDAPGASKVVVLVTDGRNNAGAVDPLTAARLARTMGVRVHAIGVGTTGAAPVPVDDPVFGRRYVFQPVDIDEGALRSIAAETGGRYFRATDARSLAAVFEQIDALETTEVRVRERVRRTELFGAPALAGGALILFEILMAALALRVDP